ncbi:MAG TPA: hypothetical protein VLI90_00810 [Tepidisphaeraceae bacterium]|nr:hypothetical protein [Tepidisphaeraceae bacterium]
MKILKWIVIVVVLVIVVGLALVYFNIDRIVKHTVETQGTDQLKVPTTLDGVSLGLFKGTVALNDLNVGSPPGFTAPHMLTLGGLNVDTGGISNLRKEPIHVSSIAVDQPKLVVEFAGTEVNFKKLMDNLPSNPDQNPPPSEKKPTKLIIDDLTVNNAHVVLRGLDTVAGKIPGLSKVANLPAELDLPIPSIDVKNIGNADGAQNGAAIKDVVTTIITQMAAKAADSDKVPPEVKAVLTGNLDAVKDKLTGMATAELNKVTDQLKAKLPAGIPTSLPANLPGNLGGLINKATGANGNAPADQNGGNNPPSPADNLLNQGLGALRGATSKPAK